MADIDFIQFRQGTPTARAGYVLASGEPGWDGDALYIGDGVTPGGKPAAGAGGGLTQTVADTLYVKLADAGAGVAYPITLDKGGTGATDAAGARAALNLAVVASTGSYADLADKPVIPAQVNADWNASTGVSVILNKPALFSGAYGDLTGLPVLGTAAAMASTAFATAAQGVLAGTAVQPGSLATVATTGAYSDLSGKPSIPAAQVNADWSAVSGVAQVLNKPMLGTAAAQDITAFATSVQGGKADSALQAVVAGANVTVDNTDPRRPIIASTAAGGGGGTVTSVALSMPATFAVTGSPITSGGTLTATYASQTAKTFFAAPNAAAGAPTFRAIAVSDVPTLNQSTTGSAAKLTTARTIAGVSFDGSAAIAIPYANLTGLPTLGTAAAMASTAFATSAQGAKADTAVQPGSLATVATTGAYGDLTAKPTLGTAAATDATAYATAAQGATADAAWPAASLTGATKIAVVATLPGTPDANTLYFTTA